MDGFPGMLMRLKQGSSIYFISSGIDGSWAQLPTH
jgi:hypothetical protein